MDFFTPLGLDQEEQESDEEARRHRREQRSRVRRLLKQSPAKVEEAEPTQADASPRRQSCSAAPASGRRPSVAPGTVDEAPRVPSDASESSDRNAPSLGKSSTGFKASTHSATSAGTAEATPAALPSPTTEKRGSLVERLSSAIMSKVKRDDHASAEDSSRVGTSLDADLREGNEALRGASR
ncbi:hypothetical protein MRX96_038189 [Rhipicephalus microplus]